MIRPRAELATPTFVPPALPFEALPLTAEPYGPEEYGELPEEPPQQRLAISTIARSRPRR